MKEQIQASAQQEMLMGLNHGGSRYFAAEDAISTILESDLPVLDKIHCIEHLRDVAAGLPADQGEGSFGDGFDAAISQLLEDRD
jgi:hypothetical protein